jgi:hypothetical protein
MSAVDNEEHAVLSVLLMIITIGCLGVSWWSMSEGYESLTGSSFFSSVLATILVVLMLALNYSLRRGLQNGIPRSRVVAIFLMYLIVVIFSFSGMFNKFYSSFMHTELIDEELTQKIKSLSDLKNSSIEALTDQKAEKIKKQVTGLVESLKLQIQNPADPGLGPRAEETLREIENLLDVRLERLPPRNNSSDELKRASDAYEDYILNKALQGSTAMLNLNSAERRLYAIELPKTIDPATTDLTKIQAELQSGNNKITQATAISLIGEAVRKYNEVALKVRSLQKEKEFQYDNLFRSENQNIGKISHTYYSASKHMDHGGTWLAAGIAFGIDLIVPFFVLFLTPKGKKVGINQTRKGPREL